MFIFSPSLPSLSFFSCLLQKFTRKFHLSITLCFHHTYIFVCCFLSFVLLPFLSALTVKKQSGLAQTQVSSIYTVQWERSALRSDIQAFQTRGGRGLIHPLSPLLSTARPAGLPSHETAHCPNSWPHAAGVERWCGWKKWTRGCESHMTGIYIRPMKSYKTAKMCFIHTCKWITAFTWT